MPKTQEGLSLAWVHHGGHVSIKIIFSDFVVGPFPTVATRRSKHESPGHIHSAELIRRALDVGPSRPNRPPRPERTELCTWRWLMQIRHLVAPNFRGKITSSPRDKPSSDTTSGCIKSWSEQAATRNVYTDDLFNRVYRDKESQRGFVCWCPLIYDGILGGSVVSFSRRFPNWRPVAHGPAGRPAGSRRPPLGGHTCRLRPSPGAARQQTPLGLLQGCGIKGFIQPLL